MKIYTKTGDKGQTGLFGGGRVSKDAPRVIAYGDVDELNACLGIVISLTPHEGIKKSLTAVQNELFSLGAQLANAKGKSTGTILTAASVDALERQMDVMTEDLEELKNFILPGGSVTAVHLHYARTVCRRAERSVVTLSQKPGEPVDPWNLIYLNRLSDYLFVLARLANKLEGIEDIIWKDT